MAKPEHLDLLLHHPDAWNDWRTTNGGEVPELEMANLAGKHLAGLNLSHANLSSANLKGADLTAADLSECDLQNADLSSAKLHRTVLYKADMFGGFLTEVSATGADFRRADLTRADLGLAHFVSTDFSSASLNRCNAVNTIFDTCVLNGADFSHSDLTGAKLSSVEAIGTVMVKAELYNARVLSGQLRRLNASGASFEGADLTGSDLTGAFLTSANFTDTRLREAVLVGCHIYGVSVWHVDLAGAKQSELNIASPSSGTVLQVDDLEIAQFLHLLIENANVRRVIDTITSKVVLILGRFTPERKAVLDAIRDQLRGRNYLPVLFDFEKPANRDVTETVSTLAHMARFVIADITDARSIPQELMTIVPTLPSVPIQPLLLASQREYGMFEHFQRFPWVLEPFLYEDQDGLMAVLPDRVIGPAEEMARRQTGR